MNNKNNEDTIKNWILSLQLNHDGLFLVIKKCFADKGCLMKDVKFARSPNPLQNESLNFSKVRESENNENSIIAETSIANSTQKN